MTQLTAEEVKAVLGRKSKDVFARWLADAIDHYYVASNSSGGIGRFEGLKPHRHVFYESESPVEWLELLWTGVAKSYPAKRRFLEDALRAMALSLPMPVAYEPFPESLHYSASAFVQFVRRQRAGSLFDVIRHRFATDSISWARDDDLFFDIIDAAHACAGQRPVLRFMEMFFRKRMYEDPRLSMRHRAVIWVAFAKSVLPDDFEKFVSDCQAFDLFIKDASKPGSPTISSLDRVVRDELISSPIVQARTGDLDELTSRLRHCTYWFLPADYPDVQDELARADLAIASLRPLDE